MPIACKPLCALCVARHFKALRARRNRPNLEALSIEQLADLRDEVYHLNDRVSARQKPVKCRDGERMVGLWDYARKGEAEGRYAGKLSGHLA